jgi:hypothetical protein
MGKAKRASHQGIAPADYVDIMPAEKAESGHNVVMPDFKG